MGGCAGGSTTVPGAGAIRLSKIVVPLGISRFWKASGSSGSTNPPRAEKANEQPP